MSSDERYYVVETNNGGMHYSPTTCRALAESTAARCNHEYPACAPHKVLELVSVEDLQDLQREICSRAGKQWSAPDGGAKAYARYRGWDPAELWP